MLIPPAPKAAQASPHGRRGIPLQVGAGESVDSLALSDFSSDEKAATAICGAACR